MSQIVRRFTLNKLKELVGKPLTFLRIITCYYYDICRYLKFSTTLRQPKTFEQSEAKMIAHYHVIEKGLSLKDTRPGFGKECVKTLLELLENYINLNYSPEKESFKAAIDTLREYISFNKRNEQDISDIESAFLTILKRVNIPNEKLGGVIELTKNQILKNTKKNFKIFVTSRHSIRNFSKEEVDVNVLIDAIKIAQKSPSVCNRQTAKAYIIISSDLIKKVLSLQNGNRGFRHLVNKLIVITSDLQYFGSIGERNQAFMDSGMFSMSFLYALHYKDLGACPLNWCVKPNKDKILRGILKIKESETIMLIIAIGHLPDKFNVTKSTRKNIDDIIEMR